MNATIRLLMRAAAPITHGASTAGNEQLIKREAVITPLGVRYVPTISGNSMRHRIIREPLAEHLVGAWGLQGTLSKEQVRFLYNGGALGHDHGTSLSRLGEVERLLPVFGLLGGSLPDCIGPGRLKMGIAWLVCAETLGMVERDTPADWWPIIAPDFKGQEVRTFAAGNAESFVGRGQYYRHDAAAKRHDLMEGGERPSDVAMMPHGGELVIAGSEFYTRLDLDRVDEILLGALLFAISEWQDGGATLGGQSSRGHGRFHTAIDLGDIDRDTVDGLIDGYKVHVESVRDEGISFLTSLYKRAAA